MKEFYTVVLDRLKEIDCTYSSEPYEAGWADEAIAFIRVHKIEEGKRLSAKIEISPDGIEWVEDGGSCVIETEGISFIKLANFGGWLRISLDGNSKAAITSYVALKG